MFKTKDPSELAEKGVRLAKQRRDREAISLLERALPQLESPANVSNVLDQLTMCYSRIGENSKADHYWSLLNEHCTKYGNFEPHFWSNRAVNLLRAGDQQGAIGALRQRIKIDNDEASRKAITAIESGSLDL